jgi:predicted HicB family RNase H-like nuclease
MHPYGVYDGYMTKHVSLRVPEALLARLQAAAERERRSLNSEVLWLIEQQLSEEERDA